MIAEIPVVTAVPPQLAEDWDRFAGDLSEFVDAHVTALTAWWETQRQEW